MTLIECPIPAGLWAALKNAGLLGPAAPTPGSEPLAVSNVHMLPRMASCLCRSDLGCDLLPLAILIAYLHALTLLQGTDLWCRVRTAP